MKLTGAAILVSRGMKLLQAAPASYPYRSAEEDKMSRGPNFIERSVFDELMAEVPRVDGGSYQDLDTAYGDMSRLVVAWLACTPARAAGGAVQ